MKVRPGFLNHGGAGFPRGERAFTLTEIMVASSVFLMTIAAILTSHVFGLRLLEMSQSRLGASDSSRKAITWLNSDLRSAKSVLIGTGSSSTFTEDGAKATQSGTAIQIYPSTDTNVYVRYFLDSSDNKLKRMTNGATTNMVVATSLIYGDIFTGEDFLGNVISNRQNAFILGVNLQFSKLQTSDMPVSSTNYYTSFNVQLKVAARSSD
jgi:hypothetical protein